MRLTLFLLLGLLAAPAAAQPLANAPLPGADFLRANGGDPVPDTTAPWRYFPLAVGNAWEYYSYFTGERRRVDVYGTETHNGRDYFLWHESYYDADGNATGTWGPRLVRFDTTTATARYLTLVDTEQWMVPCPLDASFNSEIVCPLRDYEVGGGYDGLLAFGGEFPGTGTDTVRTAVKTYYSYHPGHTLDYRYAADIGFVFAEGELGASGIYYSKVDGVEHGVSVLPPFTVDAEAASPEPMAELTLTAYPNPFGERLTAAFEVARAGPVVVEVVDVLGRVVRRRDLGVLPPGRREVALGGEGLPAGLYVVRLTAGEERTVRRVVRVR